MWSSVFSLSFFQQKALREAIGKFATKKHREPISKRPSYPWQWSSMYWHNLLKSYWKNKCSSFKKEISMILSWWKKKGKIFSSQNVRFWPTVKSIPGTYTKSSRKNTFSRGAYMSSRSHRKAQTRDKVKVMDWKRSAALKNSLEREPSGQNYV